MRASAPGAAGEDVVARIVRQRVVVGRSGDVLDGRNRVARRVATYACGAVGIDRDACGGVGVANRIHAIAAEHRVGASATRERASPAGRVGKELIAEIDKATGVAK